MDSVNYDGYLLSFATCGAGFLWVLFNQRKQAVHDRTANTVVIYDGPADGSLLAK
jgi:uncharacterized RDD family membrane protein YckC